MAAKAALCAGISSLTLAAAGGAMAQQYDGSYGPPLPSPPTTTFNSDGSAPVVQPTVQVCTPTSPPDSCVTTNETDQSGSQDTNATGTGPTTGAFGGQTVAGTLTVTGDSQQTGHQSTVTGSTDTYDSGGNLVTSTANPTVTSFVSDGSAPLNSASINGSQSTAFTGLQSSTVSTDPGTGVVSQTTNTVDAAAGNVNFSAYTGTATYDPTSNTVTVNSTLTQSSNLDIGGLTVTNGAASTSVTAAGITTNGTISSNGINNTGGIVNTGGLGTDTLSVSGAAGVGGLLSANGGLAVTGGANIDTLTVTNGASVTGGLSTDTLNASGLISANGGLSVIGGTTTDTLTVTGQTNTNGITNVGDVTTDTLHVNGQTNTNGIVNTGNVTTDTLTVNGAAGVGGLLSANGGLAVTNGASVTGGITTDTLTASGKITANGGLAVTGGATVAGGATVTGGLHTDTLVASGGITAGGVISGAGLDAQGHAVTGVANGVNATDAANFGQLTAEANRAIAAETSLHNNVTTVQNMVVTETQRAETQESALSSALTTETNARIAQYYDLRGQIRNGVAVATALSGAAFLPGKKFNFTMNVGTYQGKSAMAGQIGWLVTPNIALNAGVAGGLNSGNGDGVAFRAGATFGW